MVKTLNDGMERMAEPTSTAGVFWLLDKGWLILFAVIGWMIRQQKADKEDLDRKFELRGEMFHDAHSRLSVMERRQDDFEKRQIEDRDDHRVALDKFDSKLGDLHKELHLFRTDIGQALKDFDKRVTQFVAAAFKDNRKD